jgi:hypothetical protein
MTGVRTLGDIDPYDRTRIALTMGQAGYISESYWVSTIDPFVKKKKKKKKKKKSYNTQTARAP